MEPEIVQPEKELHIGPDTKTVEGNEEISEVAEETPVEQAAAEEELESQPEEQPEKVDEVPEVEPDSEIAKQLAKLQEEVDKANNRLGYEQRQREKLERQIRQAQEMPRSEDVNAPKQDDFETYEEFQQADIDYRVQKGISDYQRQQATRSQQSSLDGFIDETTTAGRDLYTDFDDVVLQNHVPITQPMLQIMQSCEHPESIAYYLGKNIKEATVISKMSPIQATRAITHIESKITTERATNPTGKVANLNTPKNISKAPPPVKPTGSKNVIEKDPEKMTMAEYERWRSQGGGR